MLKNPQAFDYEEAILLYEDQALETKKVTNSDKRRLRRLRRKAEQSEEATPV